MEDVRRSEELRLGTFAPAAPARGRSYAEIDASSEDDRICGDRRAAEDRGDEEVNDDDRDGIEGNVSMAGGSVNVVVADPVEVRDLRDGIERIEGTGDSVRARGLGEEPMSRASL